MGVVPALLMVATLGVTYGWQPDGRSGVEYIIQIPPEQVGEIERLGEITSTIDPAVRGRVSKVIVRVGNGPLPRTAPPELSRSRITTESDVAQADYRPLPIPETRSAKDVTSIPILGPTNKATVMKPQTGDPNRGQGFNLPPSLGGSAAPAVNPPPRMGPTNQGSGLRTQSEIDAAIGRANSAIDAAAVGANALGRAENAVRGVFGDNSSNANSRSASDLRAPSFTGNDPRGMAGPRSNGPSTEPISPQDKAWGNLIPRRNNIPSTNPVDPTASTGIGNRGVPSPFTTAPRTGTGVPRTGTGVPRTGTGVPRTGAGAPRTGTGDPRWRDNSPLAAGRQGAAGGQGATGVGLSESFGRPPAGVTLPGVNQNPAFPNTARNGASTAQLQAPTGGNPSSDNYGRRGGVPSANAGLYPNGSTGFNNASPTQPPTWSNQNDTRLTAAQLASLPPGTWTVDAYGRAIDKQGRLLDRFGRPIPPREDLAVTRTSPGVPSTQPDPARGTMGTAGGFQSARAPQTPTSDDYRYPRSSNDVGLTGGPNKAPIRGSQYEDSDRLGTNVTSRTNGGNQGERAGSSNLRSGIDPPVSTPLINFLLLISFVINIYLIAWFQKIRQRIRELVAAKRSAAPVKVAN